MTARDRASAWLLHAQAEALHRAADGSRAAGLRGLETRLRGRETGVRFEAGGRQAAREQAAQVPGTPVERELLAAARSSAGWRRYATQAAAARDRAAGRGDPPDHPARTRSSR
jgi:hypothetical protein